MKDLKKIFTEKHRLGNCFSLNCGAAQLFEANTHEFITKAMETVNNSIDKLYEN